MDEKNQKEFKKQLSLRKRGIHSTYELALNKKDGSKLLVLVSPWPVYDSKGIYKETIAVLTDIAELRLTQKKLREAHEELSLSVKTISTHRSRLLKKMALKNNTELTRYAIEHKLV